MIIYFWKVAYVALALFTLVIIWNYRCLTKKRKLDVDVSPVFFLFLFGAYAIFMRSEMSQLLSGRNEGALGGVYVNTAFRVDHNEIRLYFFQDMENRNEIMYLDGWQWKPLIVRCICPLTTLVSQCTVEGHLGVATFTDSRDAHQLILRTRLTSQQFNVTLRDVRLPPSGQYSHQLGVCLQPVYFHADWTAYVQYLEFWIASGATKFYLYIHSVTPKVRRLLSEYESLLGDSLEIVPWSDLPVQMRDRGNFFADPNTRIFSAGGHNGLNDCILRARSSVKFLAVADLDELLHVPISLSPVAMLNKLADSHPHAASFAFDWPYVQDESSSRDVLRPSDISFSFLTRLRRPVTSAVARDYARLKKMIHRPERVIMSDVHNILIGEIRPSQEAALRYGYYSKRRFDVSVSNHPVNVPHYEERYEEVRVDESTASMLHLRRFDALSHVHVQYNTSSSFDHVARLAVAMEERLKRRIADGQLSNAKVGVWYPTYEQTMRDLEQCRTFPFNVGQRIGKGFCRSLVNCEPMLTVQEAFEKGDQVWTNVAHRGKYISIIH